MTLTDTRAGTVRPAGRGSLAGLASAGGAVVVWSTNALAGGYALRTEPLGAVLVVMTAAAVLTLVAVRLVTRPAGPVAGRRRAYAFGLGLGAVGLAGTLLLQYAAFATAPLVAANVLSYGWPMFAALVLAAIGRDRASLAGLACALVGFAGVGVMFSGGSGTGGALAGYVAALLSAACMAAYTLLVGRVRIPPVDVLLAGAGAALVVALGYAAGTGVGAPGPGLLAAAYCGIGPVAAGYLLWSRGMARSGGGLAPLGYAIPLLSSGLLLLAGSAVTGRIVLGGALVVVSTAAVLVVRRTTARMTEPGDGAGARSSVG